MIDPKRLYHIGFVVPSLEEAMDELGAAFSYSWSSIREANFDLITPAGPSTGKARIVFARPGPPWLEVIQAPADSLWSAAGGAALHHLGYWVDDLDGEARHLASLGLEFEIGRRDENGQLAGFAYYRSPNSGRIEIVDERARDGLERWINEGL
ncbi:MAG: VOC family protein [Dehalococcoidia bacterium]